MLYFFQQGSLWCHAGRLAVISQLQPLGVAVSPQSTLSVKRPSGGRQAASASRQAEDTLKSASNLCCASHTAMVAGTEGGGGGGEEKSISTALTVF